MEIENAVHSLSALAQETRLAVFRLLVQAGPEGLSAGRISEALAVAPATLSFHLKELSAAGLVTTRQESRFIFYSAHYPQMTALISFLTENCCQGMPDECLQQLRTALSGCCTSPSKSNARSRHETLSRARGSR